MLNPKWGPYLEFLSPHNNVPAHFDLFNAKMWKELKWPNQLREAERNAFDDIELQPLLDQAKAFLCDVAQYDIDKYFNAVHFYGFYQRTVCKITFAPPDYRGDYSDKDMCDGDGTVPEFIASDTYHAKAEQPSDRQPHAWQMGAKEFSIYLEHLLHEIYSRTAAKAGQLDGGPEAAAEMFAKLHYVPPTFPDLTPADSEGIRKVADLVVKKLDLSPREDIFHKATYNTPNPIDRANGLLVFANLTDADERNRAWALNNAAHIDLTSKSFDQSFTLSTRALSSASKVQASNPKLNREMKDLKSKAALTAAIASARLGNEQAASKYKQIAIANGSKKAGFLLLPVPIMLPQ
jgi:hypothetical protein